MGTVFAILFAAIVFLVIIGALFVYDTMIWGLVLYKFWGWFVLPVFVGLPVLTYVQALGLMFVIGLFKSTYVGEGIKDEYRKNKNTQVIAALIMPWVALFFGWLAYAIWLM